MSQNGKLAYVIELRIRIDKEDFMHDTNNISSRWTARIKVEDREPCFKMLRKRRLGGSKETDTGQRPEILESWRALC